MPIVLRNTAQTSVISLVIIASLKLKPPSIKLEIQKSDHDRFKLQHAGVMTAHVSYPFNIGVGNMTKFFSKLTFLNFFKPEFNNLGPLDNGAEKLQMFSPENIHFFLLLILVMDLLLSKCRVVHCK